MCTQMRTQMRTQMCTQMCTQMRTQMRTQITLYREKTVEFKFHIKMLCLHGEEAASLETENGKLWHCNREEEKCHVNCYDDEYELYDKAIKEFLATHQKIPTCCTKQVMGEKTRRQARMMVVKSMAKQNFGRPFFVCSKANQDDQCDYFAWGDQTIVETPLCKHGKPSRFLKVKKEGPNKGRYFFCCKENNDEKQCKFFKWYNGPDPEDPLMPGSICLYSYPPSYKYTLKKNGAMFTSKHSDRKKAYEEFVKNNEKTDPADIFNRFLRDAGIVDDDERNLFGNPKKEYPRIDKYPGKKSVVKHDVDDDDLKHETFEPLTNTFQGRWKKNLPMKRTADDVEKNLLTGRKQKSKTDE